MSFLELKLPPPIVALCCALLMWLASRIVRPVELSFALRAGFAIALVVAGLGIALAGVTSFRRAKTTIDPTRPAAASALVRSGIYRFTRNPMYLGVALCLLGWAGFLSNGIALLGVPLFVAYIDRFQIAPEERALLARFGDEYAAYQRQVRRWL